MNRWFLTTLFVLYAAVLSGCGNNAPIEDRAITLVLGIDLDEKNNLIFSESSPVFNKNAKKNTETYQLQAASISDSKKYFNALATGEVSAPKIQVLLIGRRVLEHEDWFSILDTMYRNPKSSLNTRVLAVDGPVADAIFHESEVYPYVSVQLKEMIDKNAGDNGLNTIQVLRRQMKDKGITPVIPEIKKDKNLELVGLSLLDENGKYRDRLDLQDASLLLILQDIQKQGLTFTIPLTSLEQEEGIFHKDEVSMEVSKFKSKVKVDYHQGKFHFKYKIQMTAKIVEQLFSSNKVKEEELKKMMEEEMESRVERLIKKIQENEIDPIGLGLYARAYQYEQYKEVEDRWGEALAESNIDVSLDIEITTMGAQK